MAEKEPKLNIISFISFLERMKTLLDEDQILIPTNLTKKIKRLRSLIEKILNENMEFE